MKINPISRAFSAVKVKASQSRIALAYNIYKYNKECLAGPSVFDFCERMSMKRAFAKIISKVF